MGSVPSPLLMPMGIELGDSEKRMAAVVSSMGPDFHNFTHLLMKYILISNSVKSVKDRH